MKNQKNCFVLVHKKNKEKLGYLDYSRNIIFY